MEEKLRQLFKNRANAYLNTIDESVVQGMDEDCFIKTVNEAFALYNVSQQRELLNTFITEYNKGATDSDEIIKSISDDIIESIL